MQLPPQCLQVLRAQVGRRAGPPMEPVTASYTRSRRTRQRFVYSEESNADCVELHQHKLLTHEQLCAAQTGTPDVVRLEWAWGKFKAGQRTQSPR